MLEKAMFIAVTSHKEQVDKGENSYISHYNPLMLSMNYEINKIRNLIRQ